jgi:hypothetical protein
VHCLGGGSACVHILVIGRIFQSLVELCMSVNDRVFKRKIAPRLAFIETKLTECYLYHVL